MVEQGAKAANTQQLAQKHEAVQEHFSQDTLKENLGKLSRFGGFSFLESAIDRVQNLNPDRKARMSIYLKDEDKKEDRRNLLRTLDLWIDMLEENSTIDEMLSACNAEVNEVSNLLATNQLVAAETVKELERAYREVKSFYDNTGQDKITNISIMNASLEQVTDLDNPIFIDAVADELKQYYDKLDLRDNYSLLVVPGFLGSNKIVEKWAKIAYSNKVFLFSDFADLEKPDDVIEMFYESNMSGGDGFKSNTSLVCNWLIGRAKYAELGEEEDLHISPSSALSGKVYSSLMSQITAGKKYGALDEVDAVVFPLKKSEISKLEKMGLIPLVNEYKKVMAFSGKSLFNGDNLGLQTYSVVRVFDYVAKVLVDFLNRRAFENWTSKSEKDLRQQMIRFLDSIKGPDRLIEKYSIERFERDPVKKDRIYLDINMIPFFPAKEFVVKLDGTKGEEGTSWNSEYEMSK